MNAARRFNRREPAKRARLGARVSPEQKELIQRAAELEGRSLTDFIANSVENAARESIRAHQVLTLTARDTDLFFAAVENPPEPSPRLRAATREYREAEARALPLTPEDSPGSDAAIP